MSIKYKGHRHLKDLKNFVLCVIKSSDFRALLTTLLTYGLKPTSNE